MDTFQISYRGGLADEHVLDMRRLGYALVGLDHVVVVGLIGMTEFRFPRSRERIDVTLVAEAPREGSVEIAGSTIAAFQGLQSSFPFLIDLIKTASPDLIWHWLSATFNWLGGRHKDAEPHLSECIKFMKRIHTETMRDRRDERAFILELIESQRPNASKVAMPIGSSSNKLFISGGNQAETEIDIPMAAAIRSKDELRVSDLIEIDVRIDGITKHSDKATVELITNPEVYYHAEINDPAIHALDNVYFRALANNTVLKVLSRMSYKGDEIHRIYILAALDDGNPLKRVA